MSFEIFCNETRRATNARLEVVNSSPTSLKDRPRLITVANLGQAVRILLPFCRRIATVDQVLIFGSDNFLLAMAPLLLGLAKIFGKPCFLRSFGGSLDRHYSSLAWPLRRLLLWSLRNADGLIVQTDLLRQFFTCWMGGKVSLVSGYRYLPAEDAHRTAVESKLGTPLHLVYVGHIREEKGVFVLLETLSQLQSWQKGAIHCDIYGPIYDSARTRFEEELAKAENTTYKGVLDPEDVIPTLRRYHAVVLPSYHLGEGHPGVLIEAMMAGIPVITTAFRSIPELVEDRVNGLLVQPQDVASLTEAVQTLERDRDLLARMASNNWALRHRYDARRVVPLIASLLGIEARHAEEPNEEVNR